MPVHGERHITIHAKHVLHGQQMVHLKQYCVSVSVFVIFWIDYNNIII